MNNLLKRRNDYPSVFRHWFDWFDRDDFFSNSMIPLANTRESEKDYQIELAVPGGKKEDFKINVDHGLLTISSESKSETNNEDKEYARREFSYSSFSRSFTLPENVNEDGIKANYEDGVLKLIIPKKAIEAPKKKKEIMVQ